MSEKVNSNALKKSNRVYTKLKFVKSSKTNALISFVSQSPVTGRICGVREDSIYPKKICIADRAIVPEIFENVLYDCELVNMLNKNGYVVISATPVQFKAVVQTTYVKHNTYLVEVVFGNKTIRFNPFSGKQESVRDFKACKSVLENRIDVKDLPQVIEDFENAANDILTLMKSDMKKIRNKK